MKRPTRLLIPGLAAILIAVLALAQVVASGTGLSPQGYIPLALKAPAPARSLSVATPGPKPPIGPETITIFPNSSAFYERGSDVVRIVGELRNNTDQVISDVGLTYDLYMGDTLVQSRVTYVLLKHIPPHSHTCFLGRQRADVEAWDRYEIRVTDESTTAIDLHALSVETEVVYQAPDVTARLTARNDTGQYLGTAEYVMTLYDEGGEVVECSGLDAGFAPGEFAREHTLTFDQRPDYADAISYSLQAYGYHAR